MRKTPTCCAARRSGFPSTTAKPSPAAWGVPPDSSYRIEAALQFILRHNLLNGHTCLPQDKLLPTAQKLLSQSEIMVEKELEALLRRRQLVLVQVNGRPYCYLPEYWQDERYIAERVLFMLRSDEPLQIKSSPEQLLAGLEQSGQIRYAGLQKQAILQALQHKIFILTGGPGTGKTTTINAIIDLLEQSGCKVALCAPTGRAAKRMSEVTGREAKTIHRLLETDFANPTSLQFKRNEKKSAQRRGGHRGRDLNGRHPADALADLRLKDELPADSGRRTATSCPRWGRATCCGTSSSRTRCRRCA